MICWASALIFILDNGFYDYILEFAACLIVGGFLELYLEKKLITQVIPAISKRLQEKKEISDLENQIKKEKLQKELAELKQQNSN